jgi:hypothetical protein
VGQKDLAAPVVPTSRAVPANRSHPSGLEVLAFRLRPQSRWIDHSSQRKAIRLPRTKAQRNALHSPKGPTCLAERTLRADGRGITGLRAAQESATREYGPRIAYAWSLSD